MRNFYHIIIGFAIGYFAFVLFGINTQNFPLNLEYWNNFLAPIIAGIIAGGIGFAWEYYQENYLGFDSDMNDVIRTGIGGLIGSTVAMFFASWIVVIVVVIVSIVIVIKHYNR